PGAADRPGGAQLAPTGDTDRGGHLSAPDPSVHGQRVAAAPEHALDLGRVGVPGGAELRAVPRPARIAGHDLVLAGVAGNGERCIAGRVVPAQHALVGVAGDDVRGVAGITEGTHQFVPMLEADSNARTDSWRKMP